MTTSAEPGSRNPGGPFDAAGPGAAGSPPAQTLDDALRVAIADGQLRLLYQPVIDVTTDRITGVEALLRWEHPAWGTLSPRRFLAAAENAGLMAAIGDWTVRQACRDLRAWRDAGCSQVCVDLNLSPAQLRDRLLADELRDALTEGNIDAGLLRLELAEATLMQDPEWAVAMLRQLKETGVRLAVADYGSGFLPLGELPRFPLDRVKIGRLLVRDMETEEDDAAIVKSIVASVRRFGMRTCAEGVENDLQCKLLREMACDEMQGHLFHRALLASQVAGRVQDGKALAAHLARLQAPRRTLLLVDDEAGIVAALKRQLRRGGYAILTAGSGQEALDVLGRHEVDVIVSDQRMPGMTGTEFLRIAKDRYPDTVRIVLSGYTELESVIAAVNDGAIYKFLTKPWDDEQLRTLVAEAFRSKGLADENRRLTLEVHAANQELAGANRQLEEWLRQKQLQVQCDAVSLDILREALQQVPLPVVGLDEDDVVAFVNGAAQALFEAGGAILGRDARQALPELMGAVAGAGNGEMRALSYKGTPFRIALHSMGKGAASRGKLLLLMA